MGKRTYGRQAKKNESHHNNVTRKAEANDKYALLVVVIVHGNIQQVGMCLDDWVGHVFYHVHTIIH